MVNKYEGEMNGTRKIVMANAFVKGRISYNE